MADLDKSLAFYTKVLSFELVGICELNHASVAKLFNISDPATKAKIATLKLGEETFELMDFIEPENGQKVPEDSKSNDLWFQHIAIVVSDMDAAYKIVNASGAEHVSTMPQTLPAYITAAAVIKAFYFQDPDGHNLEVIYFPIGKGNQKWQNKKDKIFLGINHTAIGSNTTVTFFKFYRDILGLKIAGLSAMQGIGVELLDYVSPLGGRLYPKNTQANHLIHWHTIIQVENLTAIYDKLILEGYTIVSQGIVPINDTVLKAQKGLMVRDPDGHAVLLCE